MRFREVEHQERALSILRRALRSGRTHHAYLFEGPEGVGKEMAARALAARLLCEDDTIAPDADACGVCTACRLFASGSHPDFHLIERALRKLHPDRNIRASKGLFLVVDLIRYFLIQPATAKPSLGRRHVFVVREAERMNEEAQNALLKTLEEPPGETVLILVTSSAERLLPTIRSRCQRVPFGLLPTAFVQDRLASQLGLAEPEAQALARLADGRLGAAMRWQRVGLLDALDDVAACTERLSQHDPEQMGRALIDAAVALATRAAPQASAEEEEETPSDQSEEEAPARANTKAIPTDELRDALKLVLLLLAACYRDALVAATGSDATRHLPQMRRRTDQLAAGRAPEVLQDALRAVAQAERMLDQNVAPQLVGERLATALSGAAPVV